MIEIITFIKNEQDFIHNFIEHNHPIADQLTIIDNGSNDGTFDIVNMYAKKLDNIIVYKHIEHFRYKAKIVTNYIKRSKHKIIIPIDADELIGYELNDNIILNPVDIKMYLINEYCDTEVGKIKIKNSYINIPSAPNYFGVQTYNKFMFLTEDFVSVDTGYHRGLTKYRPSIVHNSNIIYLHFHYRNINQWLNSTKQKLMARLGNNWCNEKILTEYKKPKPSFHTALEYLHYTKTGEWYNIKPEKYINHNFKV